MSKWSLKELELWAQEYPQSFVDKLPDGRKAVSDTRAVLALVKAVREARTTVMGGYGFYMTGPGLSDALDAFEE